MWRITVYIGVFWHGGSYELPPARWLWLAKLRARWHLWIDYPYRVAHITKIQDHEHTTRSA